MGAIDELARLSGEALQIAEELLARGLIAECEGGPGRPTRSRNH